jgi:predicted ATPase
MSLVLTVKNFGPIVEGTVTLKSLNVFVGPNNSGKSYLSALIYSAMAPSSRRNPSATSFFRVPAHLGELMGSTTEQISKQLESGNVTKVFSRMTGTEREFIDRVIEADLIAYAGAVVNELERCVAGQLSEVVRKSDSGELSMDLTIRDTELGWRVRISSDGRNEPIVSLVRPPRSGEVITEADRIIANLFGAVQEPRQKGRPVFNSKLYTDLSGRRQRELLEDLSRQVASALFEELHSFLFRNFPPNRHYLPASRSGIMQSHRVLVASLLSSASFVGLRKMDFPELSGIVSDFISRLLTLESRRTGSGHLGRAATELESSVLRGSVVMKSTPNSYPEILYNTKNLSTPIVRVSSMISELAPVVLFLRHIVRRGDHLLLEEPEAHLHPESQRRFARVLGNLCVSGVPITLTTHSDYFLTELNNIIREGVIASVVEGRDIFAPERANDVLMPKDVSAYLFHQRPRVGGTVIRALKVTENEGIPDEEFGRVAESIYDEATALRYQIINEGIDD